LLSRTVRIPSFFHIGKGTITSIRNILDVEGIDHSKSLVISGKSFTRKTADVVKRSIGGEVEQVSIGDSGSASMHEVQMKIQEFSPSLVIGVGGGKVLDVTKYCSHKINNKPFLAIPTVLSNDGISSPVAVVQTEHGINSLGTSPPIGIIIDIDIVKKAPVETILSGVGDLVSNISAVEDWNLAGMYAGEKVDKFAEILARNSAEGFMQLVGSHPCDLISLADRDDLLILLAESLIQSGIAMSLAGSSRPCSGSEHLISHALDGILNFANPHGIQVGLATIFTTALRGKEVSNLVSLYKKIGFPTVPEQMGISISTFAEAIKSAPNTRKGRFTILNLVSEKEIQEALGRAYRYGT
jgi:glycerol-1-phosphate dehydrogenase [NAD(P)+]